jgi:peptidoglycan hydrolase-like protein with peptidoglycan-binding domain
LYDVEINGIFDPRTEKAVRSFQAQEKLKVDGKVGGKTLDRLEGFVR